MPSVNKTTYQCSLKFKSTNVGTTDILVDLLVNLGVKSEAIVEVQKKRTTSLNIYRSTAKQADELKRKIQQLHLKHVRFEKTLLHAKDWVNKWKDDFKPFALTKRFMVIPSWLKDKHSPGNKIPIYIDTSVAFGTGLHATTQMMSQFVQRCQGQFEDFLDIGTGTGILAIVAAKCGAKVVRAIDIDADPVRVAKLNFQRNQCSFIRVRRADIMKWEHECQYDFVAANIITQELIRMRQKLIALVKPTKFLAVSGIHSDNFHYFRKNFDSKQLKCVKIERKSGWTGLLYKRIV